MEVKRGSLFDSLPIIKRAKFEELPIRKQLGFIRAQAELMKDLGVEYEDVVPVNEFEIFKQVCDDQSYTVDIISMFDRSTVQGILSLKKNEFAWETTLVCRDRLLTGKYYTEAYLALDYLKEIRFPIPPLVVTFAELDYLVRLILACEEYSKKQADPSQEEHVSDQELASELHAAGF